jgi:hypothetical protein
MMYIAALVIAAALQAAAGTPAAQSASNPGAPPDGTYKYSINQNSAAIGTSTVTVKRTDAGITIHETETVNGSDFVADETLDPQTLAPRGYSATYPYPQGTGSLTAHVSFNRSGATVRFDGIDGASTIAMPSGVHAGFVVELSLMTGFLFLPAQIQAANVSQFSQILPSRVLQMVARVDRNQGSPPNGVPATDVGVLIGASVSLTEWYDPTTFVVHEVSVPSQDVLIKLTK